MQATIPVEAARRRYEDAPEVFKSVVDRAYKAARAVIEESGMVCANDDRAEEFVGAIAYYIEESAE